MRNAFFRPKLEVMDDRLVPAVLFVDDDKGQKANAQYTSIQAAVTAALPGDTVRVYKGTYREQVTVGKRLTLEAVGKQEAVIQPPAGGVAGALVRVTGAHGVVVDGFTVRGPGADLTGGIAVLGGASASVVNNLVTDIRNDPLSGNQTGFGIVVIDSDAVVAGNTVARYQKAGIAADGTGTVTIRDNTVTGVGPTATIAQNGIQLTAGAAGTVTGNRVSGNVYTPAGTESTGVVLVGAGAVAVTDNRLTGNEIGLAAVKQTAGLLVSDNRVAESVLYGVQLTDSSAAVVRGNTITQTGDSPQGGAQTGLGILLDGSSALVADNTVSKYQKAGIVAFGPGTVAIRDNTVTGDGPTGRIAQVGIQISYGAAGLVSGNTVTGNAYTGPLANGEAAGVSVFQAGAVVVSDNKVANNQIGIAAESQTAGLLVVGNRVTGSTTDGIRLTDTKNAVVLLNRVEGSGRYGIARTGTGSNTLVLLNAVSGSGVANYFDGTV